MGPFTYRSAHAMVFRVRARVACKLWDHHCLTGWPYSPKYYISKGNYSVRLIYAKNWPKASTSQLQVRAFHTKIPSHVVKPRDIINRHEFLYEITKSKPPCSRLVSNVTWLVIWSSSNAQRVASQKLITMVEMIKPRNVRLLLRLSKVNDGPSTRKPAEWWADGVA
jgi:hypothetical protein